MKFIDILSDLWLYIKEKKDHPVLFPFIILWIITHWNIFYALYSSNMNFNNMVMYIENVISDPMRNRHFLYYLSFYFIVIPIIKSILLVYNDFLGILVSLMNLKKNTFELTTLQSKNKIYEEQKRLSIEKQKELDSTIYTSIINGINENLIVNFLNYYKTTKTNYLDKYANGVQEIDKLLEIISKPSLIHYSANIKILQSELIEISQNFSKEIHSYSEVAVYDEDGEEYLELKITDYKRFYDILIQFELKFRTYIETIRNMSLHL